MNDFKTFRVRVGVAATVAGAGHFDDIASAPELVQHVALSDRLRSRRDDGCPLNRGRLKFHFMPKHASWLNMVEIEIGVIVSQCLDRRIPDKATLVAEIAAWERRRNAERAGIRWMFTVERAREKMGRAYPKPTHAAPRAAA